ncbi:MAG: 23S rRNA (pseudouridine(1915)-N(3))-methyltransferase RlmH [Pseudomonadota bacterium]|nr:23S rRNA (pseudouridine(1915)-N(3))-methyltransferase RlmH [Pseudomonadota bacterium]
MGGPDGLSQNIKSKADYIISLSDLTFPHQFVKIILSEQLYRSICIMRHHPYHR